MNFKVSLIKHGSYRKNKVPPLVFFANYNVSIQLSFSVLTFVRTSLLHSNSATSIETIPPLLENKNMETRTNVMNKPTHLQIQVHKRFYKEICTKYDKYPFPSYVITSVTILSARRKSETPRGYVYWRLFTGNRGLKSCACFPSYDSSPATWILGRRNISKEAAIN